MLSFGYQSGANLNYCDFTPISHELSVEKLFRWWGAVYMSLELIWPNIIQGKRETEMLSLTVNPLASQQLALFRSRGFSGTVSGPRDEPLDNPEPFSLGAYQRVCPWTLLTVLLYLVT